MNNNIHEERSIEISVIISDWMWDIPNHKILQNNYNFEFLHELMIFPEAIALMTKHSLQPADTL